MATTPDSAAPSGAHKPSPRVRLLAAANELFYAEGVQTVGIDRIIERAGVAKASLYSTFGSKENLVRAYLESRHTSTVELLRDAVSKHTDPRARLLAVFDAQGEVFAAPGFRGCAMVTATAEAHGDQIDEAADAFRVEIRELLTELATEAGARDPATLGRQLQLVYDGGALGAHMGRDHSVAAVGRATAAALLDAALG